MSKKNLTGLTAMIVGAVAVIAAADPVYYAVTEKMEQKKEAQAIAEAAGGQETVTKTGEGTGFGGAVSAEVVLAGDKIVGLTLTGDSETPDIGGAAMDKLKEAILAAGGLNGVDAVSGATLTSNGVFDAIKVATGEAEAVEETTAAELEGEIVTGEGEGYGGAIVAEVALDGDKIVGLNLTGDSETPAIGGAAMDQLKEAIVAAGSLEGVDAVAGATWTSNGVFDAINSAMGIETGSEEEKAPEALTAAGLTHGLGFVSSGRLGPGKDDTGTGVYSINEVVAYALFDNDGRILDLEVDQVEVATPNYDGDKMPHLTGFPGQSFNADENHDEKVDATLEQTDETYLAEVAAWQTKRERGDSYKLNSGTWEQEMDLFEEFFKGKTVEEIQTWFAESCSDLNGRPLHGASEKEEDVAKLEKLSDEQKAELDGISGATMSLNDAHGDIISALVRAYENRRAVETEKVSKIGLGFTMSGRVGPGKDDTDTGVYSFNTQAVGSCFDADGKIIALYTDVMEVATPNYDGDKMPHLTGFPGQSYNADEDHDEKAETVLEQTDETFLAEVAAWQTKRERGTSYKLNSGTWTDEMDLFEQKFAGMTTDEVNAWFAKNCSDLNGRPLHGTSEKPEDVAKYDALTEAEKADLDAISGATMSLKDAHGDILGAIEKSWTNAKATDITVAK